MRTAGRCVVLLAVAGTPVWGSTQAGVSGTPAPFAAVDEYLKAAVDSGAFPGGVLLVGYRRAVVHVRAVGTYGEDDPRPVSDTSVYDLASLTKVVGLTTAVLFLAADGSLELDRPVRDYVPEFSGPAKHRVRVRDLLLHTSGLPAWRPIYNETPDAQAALRLVYDTPLDTTPGERYRYSDLGAIVLTQVVQRVTGVALDTFLYARVFQPLDMRWTRFRPPPSWHSIIAPTERDPWRGHVLRGEVHDENAARLGGVSGHAGLFSTAYDLARFAFWWLDAYHDRLPPTGALQVPRGLAREFARRHGTPPGSTRGLGWDTPSASGSSAGECFSPQSFGHTGFTGTSLWIDPERDLVVVLLTNRVHPSRDNVAIRRVRPAVADRVVQAVDPAATCARGRAPGNRLR